MRVYVIQDDEGRIVATAPCGSRRVTTTLPGTPRAAEDARGHELEVEVTPRPLPGQTLHEVELPSELEHLAEMELHNALLRYRITSGEAKLAAPESPAAGGESA
jgi:hypothetical protein